MSITERIRYGATELKSSYNVRLAAAFTISIGIHFAAIALFVLSANRVDAGEEGGMRTPPTTVVDNVREVLEPIEPPGGDGNGKKGGERGGERPAIAVDTKRFNAVIVPDSIKVDASRFPTTIELPHGQVVTDSTGNDDHEVRDGNGNGDGAGLGDGNGTGDRNGHGGTDRLGESSDAPFDATVDFDSSVELPEVDMRELTSHLAYPRIASVNGLEGTVFVKAVIGYDGMPGNVTVDSSTNAIFERAALDAVRVTRFKPGRQNEQPVRVLILIPIHFKIR